MADAMIRAYASVIGITTFQVVGIGPSRRIRMPTILAGATRVALAPIEYGYSHDEGEKYEETILCSYGNSSAYSDAR